MLYRYVLERALHALFRDKDNEKLGKGGKKRAKKCADEWKELCIRGWKGREEGFSASSDFTEEDGKSNFLL